MSPPLDASVENLQAFSDLLEATNPPLEAGVADLGRLAQALGATEGRISSGLHALGTELDGVQKEAEASEESAVKACGALGQAAQEEVETELPDVEREAETATKEWPQELDEKAKSLDAAFQELESDGWSPLDTGLESERGDFERWAQESTTAIDRIEKAVTTLTSETEREVSEVVSALTDATSEPFFDHAFWEPAHAQANRVDTEVVQSFSSHRLDVLKELSSGYTDLTSSLESQVMQAQDEAAEEAEKAAAAIRNETDEESRLVDAALVTLEAGKVEFDRIAIEGEAAEPKGVELVKLESQIEAADARLAEIKSVMEALAQ